MTAFSGNRRGSSRLVFLRAVLLSATGYVVAGLPAAAQTQPDGARVTELDTIYVTSGSARTENSGSSIATESTIGGKLILPLRETPRSVSVLTRQRLDLENITSVTHSSRSDRRFLRFPGWPLPSRQPREAAFQPFRAGCQVSRDDRCVGHGRICAAGCSTIC